MAEIIRMPKMSDTMTEGVIASWLKKVGDKVKSGDILAEVETDKATMELENYEDGTLLYIGIKEKESVPVDGLIAIIGKEGEDISSLINSGNVAPTTKPQAESPKIEAVPTLDKPTVDTSNIKAEVIRMPKMSDTMAEGTIAQWLKKVGDKVKAGDVLAEVETDKATMELESYEDGTLLYIGIEAGNAVPVDGIIAVIGEAGTDYTPLLSSGGVKKQIAIEAPNKGDVAADNPVTAAATSVSNSSDERIKISPLAKKLAEDKGLPLTQIAGSGENGRIVKRDVENFVPSSKPTATASVPSKSTSNTVAFGIESYEEVAVSQMRKVIARRLAESMYTAPHFYLTMEINMDKAMEARTSINEFLGSKVSFNDMVIKAVAVALKKHPKVNSSWLGDKIRTNYHVHIGVAVAVEEGLLVPVVRFADGKTLSQISSEVKDLGNRAKNKQLQPSDWEGNTFTISNLGMFGIEEFTAIINPPDACILAVGGIKTVPGFDARGNVKPVNLMKVTLSCDHRVVDGAVGSAFLQTFKQLMEDPIRLLA